MIVRIIFIIFSLLTNISHTYAESNSSLYDWLAKSQEMSPSSLRFSESVVYNQNYVDINRIANATPLIKFYADILVEEGVPLDFCILPLIESGNNPQARSPANALGLWQFIPSTGYEWGLISSARMDNRTDVQKSTIAAARYLKSLYNKYGDWNLALASYNWGSGSVDKAMKKGLIGADHRIDLRLLPRETQQYLVSFYAFNQLIKKQAGQDPLKKYPNEPFLIKVKREHFADYLKANPRLYEVNEWLLKHTNGFDVGANENLSKELLVPSKIFPKYFSLNKISFKTSPLRQHPKETNCIDNHLEYIAKYGDTMASISRHYGTTVDKLRDLNPSIRELRPGIRVSLC